MKLTREDIASQLREVNRLMLISGENEFRARAFDRAAQTIESLDRDVNELIEAGELTSFRGIGNSIAEDIHRMAETGVIPVLEALRENVPDELRQWLNISGLGPRKIYKIHKQLGITGLDELKAACRDGSVAKLSGMGQKTADNILRSIEWLEQFGERCLLDEATHIAEELYERLKDLEGVERISVAGSLRRRMETIGDIDILIGADSQYAEAVFDVFTGHERVVEVLGRGETKSSVRTGEGRQVDLRIVSPGYFPATLMYFTGSKEHNVGMRQRARSRGLNLNEYGLYRVNGQGEADFDVPLAYESETDLYRYLDLHYVPPELREDHGEFACFEQHERYDLLEEHQLQGVLHVHSTWSDGKASIREMAEACMERGYHYLGLSDHSRSAFYAGGLSIEQVQEQWREIDALNDEFARQGSEFRIFKGIESDILADGSLDYPDEILDGFDFVIASVHQSIDMPADRMLERYEKAISHPKTTMLGHPTGRLLLQREGSRVDMDRLIGRCVEHGVAIEINANPWRLDLDWRHGQKARQAGLMSAICPDAHSFEGIDHIRFGVDIARKGWFGPDRILNTRTAQQLEHWFASHR